MQRAAEMLRCSVMEASRPEAAPFVLAARQAALAENEAAADRRKRTTGE